MAQGFFDLGTGQDLSKKKAYKKKIGCDSCKLYLDCDSPKMGRIGKGKIPILFVGENPSGTEDETGKIFSGRSGKYFINLCKDLGFDIFDCTFVFAVRCHGPVSDSIINECRDELLKTIYEVKPKVIIPLGTVAVKALLSHRISGRISGIKYEQYFQENIPMVKDEYWICPTFPTWLVELKREKDIVFEKIFREDIKRAFECLEKEFPEFHENVQVVKNESEAVEWLKYFNTSHSEVAFDYEATGIKPHEFFHEIKTISLSNGIKTVAFPMFYGKEFLGLLKEFLQNKQIKKIAHKLDMEDSWSKFKLGGFVKGWFWDTLLTAHQLNNQKSTQLKFQSFIKFGILGYDSEIHKFLTTSPKKDERGANAKNEIEKAPLDKLLYYNGLDSFYTLHLYLYQRQRLSSHQKEGNSFFLKSAQILSRIQSNGIMIDVDKLGKHQRIIQKKVDRNLEIIYQSPELSKWKKKSKFNPDSDKDLAELLYKFIGYKKPEDGNLADENQLNEIGTEFTKQIISYRKVSKIQNYLSNFQREQVNGIIRAFFNLHIPTTFRSSSDSPNLQNIPKRVKEAQKWVRPIVIPRKGNKLVEYDFKGMEVCVSACVHKDKNMIKYITNPKNDMHRDTTADLFLMDKEEIIKPWRDMGKNKMVFPEFYGSTHKAISPDIWKDITYNSVFEKVKIHLGKKGIRTFDKFQRHIQQVEEIFWHERFPGYAAWKKKIWREYQELGYIDLVTGFRCQGPMSFTQVTNYPIQGPAYHCLQFTMNWTQEKIEELEWDKTFIIYQIHDSMGNDVNPENENELDRIVKYCVSEVLPNTWKWIIVPLTLEKEVSEIDGNWAEMKGVDF